MANLLSVLLQLSVKVKLSTVSDSGMKGHVTHLEIPTAQNLICSVLIAVYLEEVWLELS